MTSPVAFLLGVLCHWPKLVLLWSLVVLASSSSSSQSAGTAKYRNTSVANKADSHGWNKPCDFSSECETTGVCHMGKCICSLGYYWTGRECRYKDCLLNSDCYSIWPNTKCSDQLCKCQDNFEVDINSQKCQYHFISSLKEPYFYGPFTCVVAVIVLLLALWFFCCRKHKKHTTIIFHKGDLPVELSSNVVATDNIPTISREASTPSNPPPSYTPFQNQVLYNNPVYNTDTYRPCYNGPMPSVNYARCASHQSICPHCSSINGVNEAVFLSNGHVAHHEENYNVQAAQFIPPPPPPPPPPAYTPLNEEKVTMVT